jgi:hypothetical protein
MCCAVTFQAFNFSQACSEAESPPKTSRNKKNETVVNVEPQTEWMDGIPRVGKSSDGVEVILHLPNGLMLKPRVDESSLICLLKTV